MTDHPPHVLVAYGSKRGGTREIADVIAEVLLEEGIDVELADAEQVQRVDDYDAVIIGGALYMNRWHKDAKHLVVHQAKALRERPVWLFSSGPLDASATEKQLPPTAQVASLVDEIGARGHVTFGGRLEPGAEGFIAASMAKTHAGDWREWPLVRSWAKERAQEILDAAPRAAVVAPTPAPAHRGHRGLLAALCLFVGLTATVGGLMLVIRPDGSLLKMSPELLQHSPFTTFLVPGLVLFSVVGLGNAVAGVLVAVNARLAPYAALLAGAALFVWIAIQMLMLRPHYSWLQLTHLVIAALILFETWSVFEQTWRHHRSRPGVLGSAAKSR